MSLDRQYHELLMSILLVQLAYCILLPESELPTVFDPDSSLDQARKTNQSACIIEPKTKGKV